MICFESKDGRRSAFSYSYLYKIDFDGSQEIALHFLDHFVTVRGNHLDTIFKRLRAHSEAAITELDPLQSDDCRQPCVTAITISLKP